MAELAAPQPMEDVQAELPSAPSEVPAPPKEPEFTSETLYIQNLNEKIQVGGH